MARPDRQLGGRGKGGRGGGRGCSQAETKYLSALAPLDLILV